MDIKLAILIIVMFAVGFALIGGALGSLWQDAKNALGSRSRRRREEATGGVSG